MKKKKVNKQNQNKYILIKDLIIRTDLKAQQIYNRIKIVQQNKNYSSLIYKKGNKWLIHESIIDKFKRQKFPIKYELFTTIASKNKFPKSYWEIIIHHLNDDIINNLDESVRIKYVVETDKMGFNHLHFATTFNSKPLLGKLIKNNIIIKGNNMNILTKPIYDIVGIHKYLRKQNQPVLLKPYCLKP